jgi:uncharacterized membrane protein
MATREDVLGGRGSGQHAGVSTGTPTRPRQSQNQRGVQGQRDTEVPLARFSEAAETRADGRNDRDERLANGLGWFSIGLGVAQILSPGGVARLIGVDDNTTNRSLMRAIGVREIATGVGILMRSRPAGWVRARVGGDMMDLTLLGAAMRSDDTQKTRVAAATAAVLGVTALDVICSGRLSEKSDATSASAAQGKAHVARAITIRKSPKEIYAFWRNFENLPQFMYHLESVQVRGSGLSHWTAKAPGGTTVEWDAETVEDVPNERIAWRSLPESDITNSGSVEFRPAPGSRGTEVHVQIHYDPPAGKLGQLVAKLFGEEPEQQVADDLRRLKQVLEVGEVIRSEASPEGQGRPYLAQRPAKHLEGGEARL